MIQRTCGWCGYPFDASITYRGRPRPKTAFGRYRKWCSVSHRAKSYRVRRRRLQQQEQLRERYKALERRGQLRFFEDGAA